MLILKSKINYKITSNILKQIFLKINIAHCIRENADKLLYFVVHYNN